ncbi:antitoxin [bacterium]|nr:antitoxin [bacterium]
MPRLSIELTSDEHERIKALAALEGKSVNEYVLQRSIPPESEAAAFNQLDAFLKPRIEEAENSAFSKSTFEQIKQEARKASNLS